MPNGTRNPALRDSNKLQDLQTMSSGTALYSLCPRSDLENGTDPVGENMSKNAIIAG